MWIKSIVVLYHMWAVELAQSSGDHMITLMYRVVENSFACTHFTLMSFHAQLESIYVFMTQKTLNINTMITIHTMGLQNNCNLYMLALACQGLALTDEQQLNNDSFCEFLLDKVTAEAPKKGPVHSEYFKEQTIKQVLMTCEFLDVHGQHQAAVTVTVAARARQQPHGVHAAQHGRGGLQDTRGDQEHDGDKKNLAGASKVRLDPFICAHAEDMIAELLTK